MVSVSQYVMKTADNLVPLHNSTGPLIEELMICLYVSYDVHNYRIRPDELPDVYIISTTSCIASRCLYITVNMANEL